MATAERHLATADQKAWDLFFEALDADSDLAARIPPGAAVVAADEPDRGELVRRYHADRRSVVVVHEDGRIETLRPQDWSRLLIVGAGLALLAWLLLRSGSKSPA
jgi:ABC-type phosphate/phosphonate transport system substrate-binding protein